MNCFGLIMGDPNGPRSPSSFTHASPVPVLLPPPPSSLHPVCPAKLGRGNGSYAGEERMNNNCNTTMRDDAYGTATAGVKTVIIML